MNDRRVTPVTLCGQVAAAPTRWEGTSANREGRFKVYEPDPATIRAAMGGDIAAFEELVRGLQAQVWRYLRHLLGDDDLAEDVTQETFIRVYRRLRTFRFRSKFSTWVFQVARNAGIDAIRSRARLLRLTEQAGAVTRQSVSGPEATSELRAAVDSLPVRLREALLTVEILGLRYREASQVLGIPEGTVKSRVHHARQRLTAWLAEGELEDAGDL
ncbi:MAG TPA: RNA polymerase sigma factor [Acidimicrobiia bacterium]|jgi:RNA polymerase sigma-70 factor (ECF subfamily)|nr:RNA polymerase sigma factor [Acidimicrobiia bacterium]